MGRARQLTSVDYSNQLSINMNELDKREKMNVNDVVSHRYLQQILHQYERLGLKADTLLFSIITALGAISCRSFIRRMDNMPILLSHGSLIVGRTGTNKSSYIKLIRHGIATLTHYYENIYYPDINKYGNQIDSDQGPAQTTDLSNTSTKMTKASFMTEVCTELAITKNLATTDTFLCHDEGDVILTTFGFYSPADSKHAGGINLMCSGLDGLVNYNRTTGRQNIHIENSTLSTFLATTGWKMSATLQAIHQKHEDVGLLGRLNIWHIQKVTEFLPPPSARLINDVASVDHLLIIAHEIVKYSPEFRFKKHMSDYDFEKNLSLIDDSYMKELRREQGIISETSEITSSNINQQTNEDVFDVCPSDFTEDGIAISAFKLVYSILNSEFQLAEQTDEHLGGIIRKSTNKFPRICALFCLLEIISDIASKLLKFIIFDEGNFSRPNSMANEFISTAFVLAARKAVNEYLEKLPEINNRPIIYIDKNQVERAYVFYSYIELTTKMLYDTSDLNQLTMDTEKTQSINKSSPEEQRDMKWIIKVMKAPVVIFSRNYLSNIVPGCSGSGVLKNASNDVRNNIIHLMIEYGLLVSGHFITTTKCDSFAKLPPNTLRQQQQTTSFFNKCGQMFTINNYEKLFETFGLMTMSDASIIPITQTGINVFRDNNNYVHYYHRLQKDKGVNQMIQERLALKEINIVYDYQSGPYRYQVNSSNKNYNDTLFNNRTTINNEESDQNQQEATNSSSVNNDIIDVDQNSNARLVNNNHYHNNEDDIIEFTDSLMKLEHEPNLLLILSEFIDKYKEEKVGSTFEENNSAMAYQLLTKLTSFWFGSSNSESTCTLTMKEIVSRMEQKVGLPHNLKKFMEICQQIMFSYRREKHDSIIKQQKQFSESFSSDNTRLSTKSSISINNSNQRQLIPITSSLCSSVLFQSPLNINEDPTVNNNQSIKPQTIIEEDVSTSLNCDIQNSEEYLLMATQLTSEIIPLTTDRTVIISSSNNRSSTLQEYDSSKCPTDDDSNNFQKSLNSIEQQEQQQQQQQQSTAPFQTSPNSTISNPSEQVLSSFNTTENLLSTTSSILPSSNSIHLPSEETRSVSKSLINKPKRGRKSKTDKDHELLSDDAVKTILADKNHPIYKRVILLNGFVFSKTYLTHALQQYSALRDGAIKILYDEGIFLKENVFAKKNSNGIIEYLDGYIKCCPTYNINNSASSYIENNINFAGKLGEYNITLEEYISSFDNKQSSPPNSNNNITKRVLSRTDVHLTTYLFSTKLVDFINTNDFYSQRFVVSNEAVCWSTDGIVPTTSSLAIDEYQQAQYSKINQRQISRKRAYQNLLDTAGPAPKQARRRPQRFDQE